MQASRRQFIQCIEVKIVKDSHITTSKKRQVEELKSLLSAPLKWSLPLLAVGGFGIEGPASIAQALAVLAGVVFVHECGHFFAARVQGIKVKKFSVGFGPSLLSFTGGDGVEYSLSAVPLGGFVSFPDVDDPDNTDLDSNDPLRLDPQDPDLLLNRPVKDRVIVVSAGVLANVAFAFAVLFTQMSTVGAGVTVYNKGVVVPELLPVSAAADAGMKVGDIVLSVNGASTGGSSKSVQFLVDKIRAAPVEPLKFHIQRGDEELDLTVVPDIASDGGGRIGVSLATNTNMIREKPGSVGEAVGMTAKEYGRLQDQVTGGLKQIFSNFSSTASQMSGPIAIVAVGAEVARTNALGLFQFCAILNINLAVVNTLPLPALDGGYLVLLLLEAVRGEKLNKEVEQAVTGSGFLLLLSLGLYLIVKDTLGLF
eukprot:CAMPEP_0196593580 /NCGR_PEP_ID=MMETSP1081-20130531/76014_1 /TAXON_ID=36882 /ORGANISM="Pyramimonas amylifera, Strain CCMP720" /LENGTH=423 /DNA_ID=CAMNT_0041917599 /DNA_START=282 /DNA_END=1553 /DNA_ORIENTATION=+